MLYAVCQHHSEFALEESRLQELLELLTGSLLTCHVSSRQMRLRCLDCLVGAFDPSNESHMAAIPNMLGEVRRGGGRGLGAGRGVGFGLGLGSRFL